MYKHGKRFNFMDNENKNVDHVDTNDNSTDAEQTVTMSQAEFNKKIQGEGDRVRTEYSKKVKELEAKIKELTPVKKTEAEIDFENRLAALEAREKKAALLDSLTENGISHEFADYFRSDADIAGFSKIYKAAIDSEVQKKVQVNGYVPDGHKAGTSITKDDFAKMNMTQKEKLYAENPELYKSLTKR